MAACSLLAPAAMALQVVGAIHVHASGPTVTGAGSTWVQIALDQWRADIARQGYAINYQGVGSSAGRQFYIINQVDFAASEIPFQPDEVPQLQAEHKSYQYVPDVAGGTSLMYNLHTPAGARITSLRIDATAAARIFTGALTSWQDPAIQALNPGLSIRETRVVPVIRSDGSGTSAQFSLYLADQGSAVWNAFVASYHCPAPCSLWPPFPGSTQQAGSDGVANFVSNDAIGGGSMGYVEAGYAYGRGFPVANLHNVSGNFVQPSSTNVATALKHATLNADLTQNLVGVYRSPESNAYPMSSYSYLITQTTGFDPAKGAVLGMWMIYIACSGQREAAPLGYSPLPPNLVKDVFDAVRRIPGAPTPPPIDRVHCPNPNVTNAPAGGGSTPTPSPTAAPTSATTATATPSAGGGSTTGGTGSGGGGVAQVGLGAATGPQTAVLDPTQRQAAFVLAEVMAAREQPPPILPLVLAAFVIVALVFSPILAGGLLRRRRQTTSPHAGRKINSPQGGEGGEGSRRLPVTSPPGGEGGAKRRMGRSGESSDE
jgi:phosphate transport system substrate-binding protein